MVYPLAESKNSITVAWKQVYKLFIRKHVIDEQFMNAFQLKSKGASIAPLLL